MAAYRVPWREIGLIGLSAAALYIFLAVASYSPLDPSSGFSGEPGQVRNWVGTSGAYVSYLLLTLLGFVAYGVPLALALAGLVLLKPAGTGPVWARAAVRALAWAGIAICTCVLIQLHALHDPALPAGTGGALGAWFRASGPAASWLGRPDAHLYRRHAGRCPGRHRLLLARCGGDHRSPPVRVCSGAGRMGAASHGSVATPTQGKEDGEVPRPEAAAQACQGENAPTHQEGTAYRAAGARTTAPAAAVRR